MATTASPQRQAASETPTPRRAGSEGAVARTTPLAGFLRVFVLVTIIVWCITPFLWMLNTSFKLGDQALNNPNPLTGPFGLDNYREVFAANFIYNLRNSFIVAGTTTVLCVTIGSLAAYALVRLPIKNKVLILSGVLAVSLFPPIALVPPMYDVWRAVGLLDTYPGLYIPYIAFTLPLTIFVLTTFFASIPPDMEEAAKVDGATPMQTFLRVVIPLAAPGIFAAAIIVFVYAWNEFLLASVFAPRELSVQTVPVAIANFTGDVQYQRPIGSVTAGSVIVTIPMVLMALVFQKRIIAGLTAGGVKG